MGKVKYRCNAYFYTEDGQMTKIDDVFKGFNVDLNMPETNFIKLMSSTSSIRDTVNKYINEYGSDFIGYDVMPEGLYEVRNDYTNGSLKEEDARYKAFENDIYWKVVYEAPGFRYVECNTGFWKC